jgi:hypothetical protein
MSTELHEDDMIIPRAKVPKKPQREIVVDPLVLKTMNHTLKSRDVERLANTSRDRVLQIVITQHLIEKGITIKRGNRYYHDPQIVELIKARKGMWGNPNFGRKATYTKEKD